MGDLKAEINERVNKFLALQADFNVYKADTNDCMEKMEASLLALEQHAKDTEESYDNLGLGLKNQVSEETE